MGMVMSLIPTFRGRDREASRDAGCSTQLGLHGDSVSKNKNDCMLLNRIGTFLVTTSAVIYIEAFETV